jgi:glycosyltransferase involved in cell wall biosynthesis
MSHRGDEALGAAKPVPTGATQLGGRDEPRLPPLLPDVGVIALVPDPWAGIWQSRHYILTRLARYFHVVWCHPDDNGGQHHPGNKSDRNDSAAVAPPPGFMVHDLPAWIRYFRRPAALSRLTMRERLRSARRLLARRRCDRIVLSLWRPVYAPAVDLVPHDVSCYHIDDEYTFSEVEQASSEEETSLIRKVDQVFVSSRGLLEKKGDLNPHTVFVPNGVDYAAYVRTWPEPPDLQPIPHPRVGYVGVIKKQLNLALLHALAERHRSWSFVFVGPHKHPEDVGTLIRRMAKLPNVHFLGEKPVNALPSYTQHMDVCTLCYNVDDYTKFIYPLKLHESLASGHPCVGAPIRTLQAFHAVVDVANTVEEWSEALATTLSPSAHSEARIAARRAVARDHDWERLVDQIAVALGERLGSSYRQRIQHGIPASIPLAWDA